MIWHTYAKNIIIWDFSSWEKVFFVYYKVRLQSFRILSAPFSIDEISQNEVAEKKDQSAKYTMFLSELT